MDLRLIGKLMAILIACSLVIAWLTIAPVTSKSTPKKGPKKMIRAIFMGGAEKREPLKGKPPDELAAYLADLGINAVFFGEPNEQLIQPLHKAGIEVHSEIGLFTGKGWWDKYPESRPITDQGLPLEKDGWYYGVCPNQEWLRQEKLEEIRQRVQEHELDGIWLDFIRYPCHWEVKNPRIDQTCFCPVCLAKFQKDTKINIPARLKTVSEKAEWILNRHGKAWTRWKCRQIANFCRDARSIIRKVRPGCKLGLFGVPWTEEDFDDAIHRVVCQDYKMLNRWIDIFSPMVYHKMCYRPVGWIGNFTTYLVRKTGKPVWPIVQAGGFPEKITLEEFEQELRIGLTKPSSGVIIFTMVHVIKENELDTVRQVFGEAE